MKNSNYHPLYPLSQTNYEIVDGEPDITGWAVVNETDLQIGTIRDLLFDAQSNAVRYLVIDLSADFLPSERKSVMIPIGIAHLHEEREEVILPNLHLDQYQALPAYQDNEIGPATEQQIRTVIGSPAALRMEEAIVDFDQQQFYLHHHFESNRFYRKRTSER